MPEPQEIKMDYALMEEMRQTFHKASEQLQSTRIEMENIAKDMEGGALLGRAGASFTDGLRGKLIPAIQRMQAKFEEMEGDVVFNVERMRRAEAQAAEPFQSH